MPVAVIINPRAGRARPGAARARTQLALDAVAAHGDAAEVFVTERPGHARELAKAAVAGGARLVLVWGGDGTVNEVASALAFQEVPLGIVPAGSGNGLARELGIDARPAAAIARALEAESRPMDVGEIGDRLFVNIAGIGLDAHVAARFNAPDNPRRGPLGYVALTATALLSYKSQQYRIETEQGSADVRAVLIAVANSAQFGNGARIAPGAAIADGLLDLVVVSERSRLATIGRLGRLFNGTVDRAPGCSIDRIREATIEAAAPIAFHVDGEPRTGGTRLAVRVHPGALRIAA